MYQIFVKSKEFSGMSVLAQHRSVKEVSGLSSTIFVS